MGGSDELQRHLRDILFPPKDVEVPGLVSQVFASGWLLSSTKSK